MKKVYCIVLLFCIFNCSNAQSIISIEGGYCQSIFYCSQLKSNYYYSFSQYNSYYTNITYKEDVFKLSKNMRFCAQLGWKQQSQWVYREDKNLNDTFAIGVRYDVRSINLCIYPEIVAGDFIKFHFSAGPIFQFIVQNKAQGKRLQLMAGQNKEKEDFSEQNSQDIKGFSWGAKINLGVEIPLYKGLYLSLNNAYSAGFSGFNGNLKPKMKFINCIDIYLGAGLFYTIEHKDFFPNRKIKKSKKQ